MPTLIEVDVNSLPVKAHQKSSSSQRPLAASTLGPAADDDSDIMNDTTLSASMLEEALQAMSIDRQHDDLPGGEDGNDTQSLAQAEDQSSVPTKPDEEDAAASSLQEHLHTQSTQVRDIPPHRPDLRQHRSERSMGPNELLYRETYASKVDQWMKQGQARFPERLRDYRSMSTPEKTREQQRVMSLLSRLGIRGGSASADDNDIDHDDASAATASEHSLGFAKTSSSGTIKKSGLPNSPADTMSNCDAAGDTTVESVRDASALLFSPPIAHQGAKTPVSSVRFSVGNDEDEDSFSSATSVEQARRARSPAYSPAALHRKRLASVSGKRGADHARLRMDSESHGNTLPDDFFPVDDGSRECDTSPMRGISPVRASYFPASQSPISPRSTSPLHSSDLPSPQIPLNGSSFDDSEMDSDSSSESTRETLVETRWQSSVKSGNPLIASKRHNVGLKTGAIHHCKALETKTHRSRTLSFPDPLAQYGGSIGRRLDKVLERLQRRDSIADETTRAILVSMTAHNIRDVSLKLLLSDPPVISSQYYSESQQSASLAPLQGQTLIVLREKETVSEWSCTFREGSPFSVLDFLTLPVRQRKSLSTASKLTKYGVVLTTFDALKAADVTLAIDDKGQVRRPQQDDEGWHESRGSSSARVQTKQLTVLHCLSWHRVIFVDVVGRKSFVAKADTSRSVAAAAISSQRRYIAFLSSMEDEASDPVKAIIRSDKSAASSVASILHITGSFSLQQQVIDLIENRDIRN